MPAPATVFLAAAAYLALGGQEVARQGDTREAMGSAGWWVATYGTLDESDGLGRRATEVFRRVAAAADKRGNRQPKLVLLRRPPRPEAQALPDGSVVVTRAALELCYRSGRDAAGDAKLAFVFGHELSHLATDDFWRGPASFGEAQAQEVQPDALTRTASALSEARARESKADAHGITYVALAGYDARVVTRGSFLSDWVSQRGEEESAGPSNPALRAEALRLELMRMSEELDVFNFGVRLLQLGRHEDALVLLERFRTQFPGREVHNDVGLGYLQIALRFLASCDKAQYLRFKLPLVVDPETLARSAGMPPSVPHLRGPGSPSLDCVASARFHTPWSQAEASFKEARKADAGYVAASVNLATALLVVGNGSEAFAVANEALELDPGNQSVRLQWAIALYLMGNGTELDTLGAAIESLRKLQAADGGPPEVAYGLARILTERGRPAAANQAWRRFLALEPSGSYAAEALRWLPDPSPPSAAERGATSLRLPQSPLALGTRASAVREQKVVREIHEGSFRGSILRGNRFSALAIDDVVEIVERRTQDGASPAEVYGRPQRTVAGKAGDLFFYPGLMVEWAAGRTRVEVFFQATSRSAASR